VVEPHTQQIKLLSHLVHEIVQEDGGVALSLHGLHTIKSEDMEQLVEPAQISDGTPKRVRRFIHSLKGRNLKRKDMVIWAAKDEAGKVWIGAGFTDEALPRETLEEEAA